MQRVAPLHARPCEQAPEAELRPAFAALDVNGGGGVPREEML